MPGKIIFLILLFIKDKYMQKDKDGNWKRKDGISKYYNTENK